jgi:helicase
MLKMVGMLEEWEFITTERKEEKKEKGLFSSALDIAKASVGTNFKIHSTPLGVRISELYLDPYTAHHFLTCMKRANKNNFSVFSIVHMVCYTLELRPLLRIKQNEYDEYIALSTEKEGSLVVLEPDAYDEEFDMFLEALKTAHMLCAWTDEVSEDKLLEKYDVRPGELHHKLQVADWLLYSCEELSRLVKFHAQRSIFRNVRMRLKYGAKEELLPLLRLKGIGRVKARRLYQNGIKDLGAVKDYDITTLVQLLGKLAYDIKKQVGVDIEKIPVKENKRKGQINLKDYEGQ